nr:single-stranded DNA-binding protein [Mastomys natalensis cytomegalovirus 3]WEG69893.1 single-stranded DNA-binding protein [Mastomys natalensis cytomegalovirus 3]WEG70033.1 single-stranded DNA-binding protein [Mastomys natalensis cytomegalovirus 3]WEG70173.1 single-stranded DNA-binding protein [Mastomys natalensis cytomegalovirus 3]WEG70313.1 single-stranded DNA-binding protein [Mastomys natalensis cytomegalovirus 3]
MAEDDLSTLAPVSPAAWLYFARKNREVAEILAILSLCDKRTSVIVCPLLVDLTVDRDFCGAVRTPMSTYEGGVLTKVTSFCPFAFLFYNTSDILSYVEDHGDVETLCEDARKRFGVQSFVKQNRRDTDVAGLCEKLGLSSDEYIGYVVCGNGMKEMLYFGHLVPCVDEAVKVHIGNIDGVKVPLYSGTLFASNGVHADDGATSLCRDPFLLEHGLYISELSECLYYFMFTAWGQSLRVCETEKMIEAGLQQFVEDMQQTVKLAPFKKYHGYCSQKLSAIERDQLMTVDVLCSELAFSYASIYLDSVYDLGSHNVFSEWPLVKNAKDHADLLVNLTEFQMHLSKHIAALMFSSNSILYQTRIVYVTSPGKGSASTSAQETLLKAIRFFNGMTGMYEDMLNDCKKSVRFDGGVGKDEKYTPLHLAYFCGTSPQLVSGIIWFFNRMAVYSTGVSGGDAIFNHIVNSSSNLCKACGGECCHTCYFTAFARISTRLPSIPKQIKKEPVVVTLPARAFADADILGNYGKKYGTEAKDAIDGGRADDVGGTAPVGGLNFVSVDRLKYMSQIMDYCKKNSLIDSTTGEDIMTVRSKKEFVSVVTSLNQFIDDAVCKFAVDVRRSGHGRDEIAGSTQSFNLDLNPYAGSFSPILSFQYYRTIFSIIQNLALINASSYVVDNPLTTPQISRWVMMHFQSICGAFGATPLKKGFLHVRDTKNQKTVEFERLMDFKFFAENGRYQKVSMEIKSCKMSVQSLRSCRIKNRPIAKVTRQQQVSAFFKKGAVQRKNPIKGCLSFLLFRCHDKLFPGCGLSCIEFWQRVLQNSLPKSVNVGKVEEFDALVKFLLTVTDDYDESDVTDVQPDCVMSYIENRFHNKFLYTFGFRDYVSTIQGMTTRLTPQNYAQFPYLLKSPPKFSSVGEYILHFKKMKLDGVRPPVVCTIAREAVLKNVFESRSLVSVSFSIEKFASTMTTRDVFQFGQIGYYVGSGIDRSLNTGSMGAQDYRFLRYRYIIATKLVDVIIRRSRRETVLYDADIIRSRVLAALDSSGLDGDPEILAIAELMEGRDGEIPEIEDILFYVDQQEYIARSLHQKMCALVEKGVTDFSLQSLRETVHAYSDAEPAGAGNVMYDFSSLLARRDEPEDVNAGLINGDDRSEDEFELPSKRSRL